MLFNHSSVSFNDMSSKNLFHPQLMFSSSPDASDGIYSIMSITFREMNICLSPDLLVSLASVYVILPFIIETINFRKEESTPHLIPF